MESLDLCIERIRAYLKVFLANGTDLLCSVHDIECSINVIFSEKSFVSATFWCVCGLSIITRNDVASVDLTSLLNTLEKCLHEITEDAEIPAKGFSQYKNTSKYVVNIQSTLHAIQTYYLIHHATGTLFITEKNLLAVIQFTKLLWNEDTGGFHSTIERRNNYDLRHTMSALCTFHLSFKLLNRKCEAFTYISSEKIYNYIKKHFNDDGGISLIPKTESHAAAAFCAVGSLMLIEKLHLISSFKINSLVIWLLERVSISGGVNGRIGKSADICYSWWVLATLALVVQNYPRKIISLDDSPILNNILNFILNSQNDDGGYSKGKGDKSDPYHTFTAILTISLINDLTNSTSLNIAKIQPLFALPII